MQPKTGNKAGVAAPDADGGCTAAANEPAIVRLRAHSILQSRLHRK